ncbi:MAG: hypothetical protein JWO93_1169 [Micrococcaceae bacterium]|nr:hypothetical protein [Micrococcaceae bacterium]
MSASAAPFPFLRAGVAAGMVLALSGGAHVAAGGALPSPVLLAALMAFTLLPTVLLARLRIAPPLMVALLGASQYVLHSAFDRLSSTGAGPGQSTLSRLLLHEQAAGHHGLAAMPDPLTSDAVGWPGGSFMGDGMPLAVAAGMHQGMAWWHGAATLATALILARGEAALWALAGWLRPLLDLPRPGKVDDVVGPARSYPTADRPRRRLQRRPATLRGPPAFAAVFA